MRLPSLKRDAFLSKLARMGVSAEYARGGGSLVKLRTGGKFTAFHVHPSKEIGPPLQNKVLRDLGIDYDSFQKAK